MPRRRAARPRRPDRAAPRRARARRADRTAAAVAHLRPATRAATATSGTPCSPRTYAGCWPTWTGRAGAAAGPALPLLQPRHGAARAPRRPAARRDLGRGARRAGADAAGAVQRHAAVGPRRPPPGSWSTPTPTTPTRSRRATSARSAPAAQLWGTAPDLARWAAFLADPAAMDPAGTVLRAAPWTRCAGRPRSPTRPPGRRLRARADPGAAGASGWCTSGTTGRCPASWPASTAAAAARTPRRRWGWPCSAPPAPRRWSSTCSHQLLAAAVEHDPAEIAPGRRAAGPGAVPGAARPLVGRGLRVRLLLARRRAAGAGGRRPGGEAAGGVRAAAGPAGRAAHRLRPGGRGAAAADPGRAGPVVRHALGDLPLHPAPGDLRRVRLPRPD